ncbi:hypothetical protein SAMN05660443_0208 [Marinospirillum celere]|uniref:Uncharacterized protein n=1 Tax=Marinospirillum celere TaxID=1122252 RepID=A0A1I1DZ15_9GAMM|nr:hypothetical protein [Marinospirillum celere]SFB80047.1 hypothetical protein SAMN05660443_0208 [Marinospirillum celere]
MTTEEGKLETVQKSKSYWPWVIVACHAVFAISVILVLSFCDPEDRAMAQELNELNAKVKALVEQVSSQKKLDRLATENRSLHEKLSELQSQLNALLQEQQ